MHIQDARSIRQLPVEQFHDPVVVLAITNAIPALESAGSRRAALGALIDQLLAADETDAATNAVRLAPELTPADHANDVDPWFGNALILKIVDRLLDHDDASGAAHLLDEAERGLHELSLFEPSSLPIEPPWLQLTKRYRRIGRPDRIHGVWSTVTAWAQSLEQALSVPDPAWFQPEDGSRFLLDIVAEMLELGQHELARATAAEIRHEPYRTRALLTASGSQHARPAINSDAPAAEISTIDDPIRKARSGPWVPLTDADWRASFDNLTTQFTAAGEHYWRHLPAGTYMIGGWAEYDPYAGPLQRDQWTEMLPLEAFWLGRLPVTVAQFQRFVVDGGYADDACWTPHGLFWRNTYTARKNRSEPPLQGGADQPVVHVNWYEATAYCRWLSAQYSEALPTDYLVRLPSEAEWEVAAAYDGTSRRRPHPWGDAALTAGRAATAMSRLSSPAPVGACTAGKAACGALDLVGGSREWSGSAEESYPKWAGTLVDDHRLHGEVGPLSAALRGVSWRESRTLPSNGARSATAPNTQLSDTGFRLALARRADGTPASTTRHSSLR